MAKQLRENVVITSSAANTSGLQLKNLTAVNSAAYTGILAHDATGNVVSIAGSSIGTITVSATAPATPKPGQLWLDTSVTPNELNVWNGTTWIKANDEVQHFANLAAFPAAGVEGVVYVDDATDIAYVWDVTGSVYKNTSGTGGGLFSITDGVTTESIGVGNTVTFNENATLTSVFNLAVSATDTVTLGAVAGHTSGQTIVSNGTNFSYGSPIAKRYVSTFTPTANVAFTHTHALGTADPIVQVRDAVTNEVVGVEIIIISATQFDIISTTTDALRVVAI